jgi:hypothetical protein
MALLVLLCVFSCEKNRRGDRALATAHAGARLHRRIQKAFGLTPRHHRALFARMTGSISTGIEPLSAISQENPPLTAFRSKDMTRSKNGMRRLFPLRVALLFCGLAAGWCPDLRAAETTEANDMQQPGQAPAGDLGMADGMVTVKADPSITLKGAVWRTKAGIVFLKTPVGLLTLSSKTTLKDLKGSHEVAFWVHERNVAVEVRRRSDGSLVHRYLSGPMAPGQDSSNTLRYWTAGGEQTVHYGTQQAKLSAYHEGDQLTVEVDESQTVIGVHDLQFDLQISQSPPSGSPAQVLLSGSVSKTKSNFVFFRTPVGVVMVNAKIGVPPVKVGQAMTLHIDDGHVNVEVSKSAKPAARGGGTPVSPATAPF